VGVTRFHVTIDRLILPGIDGGNPAAVVEALRAELTRQFSAPGARAAWGDSRRTPVMKLGRITLASGAAGSRNFGTALARGIGRGSKR